MRYTLLVIIAILCNLGSTKAQNELHFTQYEMAPLVLNSALAGDFRGTYRIGGIYRDQWFSVLNQEGQNPFRTLDLFVDVNVIPGLRKQDWISVGLGYDALDQAGSGNLKNTYSRINAAYHLSLDKKQGSILSLGVQRLSKSTQMNVWNILDARGPEGTDITKANQGAGENGLEGDYSDWVFGLTYNLRNKTSDFIAGIKAGQLFKPRQTIANTNSEQDPLIAAFATYKFAINEGMWLAPSLLYQKNGPASEFVMQGRVGFAMNKTLELNGGLGMRMGDALQILAGARYKQYQVGVSYDITVSDLNNAGNGSFELALNYTGIITKKPKVKPIIICPRL